MNIEQLLDQFELVTDTQEGLEQLRKVILKQAIRGNLTERNFEDEPAEKHLERIEAEKNRLYNEDRIRKPKDLPPVKSEEVPYEIPNNWSWTRLGEIGSWGAGATPTRSDSEYFGGDLPWLKTGELNDGYISSSEEAVTQKGFENSSLRLCKPGDVLIAMYGATIGKLGILEIEATTNQACCACTPYADLINIFLFYYLLALRDDFRSQGAGGAQPNISKTKIEHTLLSLPPVEEQQRIVQKIETLFSQVDELEQKVQQDQEVDERLQVAVLDELQRAETPETSRQSWQRLTDHFEQIYRKPEHIDQLKQAILNEAVRGRLVPQNPVDEPAKKLLERIKEEKQRLYDEGEIRKPKELPEIKDEESPYELPDSWTWCRLGYLGGKIGSGKTPRGGSKNYVDNGIKFLRSQNVWNGGLDLEGVANIPEETHKEMSNTEVRPKDLLLNITGASIGRCAIVPDDFDFGNVNQHVCIIRPIEKEMKSYMHKFMVSPVAWSIIMAKQVGISREGLSKSKTLRFTFPLPPLAEQKRIADKVEDLFAWCDNLKSTLSRARQTDRRLLEALVNGAE